MGEVNGDYDAVLPAVNDDDEDRVHEWEFGLPNAGDITPLNHGLIPLELLSAFNIKPEPYRTAGDVSRASEDTLSTIRGSNFKTFADEEEIEEEIDDHVDGDEGSDTKKPRRNVSSPEDADSAAAEAGKVVKRPRLVWTPQLHKRFVDVVTHLGIKNAVPKTIMQLMNVEGLTRENVASHLQKYRLYLKRMQGGSFDAGSSGSSVSAQSSPENGIGHGPGPYGGSPMVPVPMPMIGMGNYNGFNNHEYNNQYNGMMQTGSSFMPYPHPHHLHHHPPHVTPGDK